jgi:hypothetical protein
MSIFSVLRKSRLCLPAKRISQHKARSVRPLLELLEDRTLLANVPIWTFMGPMPQTDPDLFLSSTGESGSGGDQNYSGRTAALAVSNDYDGQGHAALFAGSASGGVWRTVLSPWNNGSFNVSWQPLGNIPANTAGLNNIGALAIDSSHSQRIYAGTGEANYSTDNGPGAGILESANGGNAWTLSQGPGNAFVGHAIAKIIVDSVTTPTINGVIYPTGTIVYAAVVPAGGNNAPDANDGLYKSLDNGLTWSKLALGNGAIVVTDLEYTVVNGSFTLYAAVGTPRWVPPVSANYDNANNGIWKSRDGGASWTQQIGGATPTGANIGRISLAADHTPGNAPEVYAAIATPPTAAAPQGALLRIISSTDNGNNLNAWAPIFTPSNALATATGGDGYKLAIGVLPGNQAGIANTIYFGALNPIQSSDDGVTWTPLLGAGAPNYVSPPHIDHHAWAFYSGVAFDGNDGGVWELKPSVSNSLKWVNLNGPTGTTDGLGTTHCIWRGVKTTASRVSLRD